MSFSSQYPTLWIWFLIPHRSTFVSSTPPINFRLKYPTYWNSFFIPLCSVFVFDTPILEFGFLNPMCEFRFVKMNLVLLFLSVYYIMQKIVKFLLEMSVFCQNLWYNVYSDNFRAWCSRIITSSFLIHGNSSSKTYLANRSFLFVPTKGTLLNGTPTKQYVFDSLRFTIVLSTQIGKWTLQNKIPVLRTLSAPSSRLFLTCRIFSFWNFHFPIFSYDFWNSSENVQSSRKLFFFLPYM